MTILLFLKIAPAIPESSVTCIATRVASAVGCVGGGCRIRTEDSGPAGSVLVLWCSASLSPYGQSRETGVKRPALSHDHARALGGEPLPPLHILIHVWGRAWRPGCMKASTKCF